MPRGPARDAGLRARHAEKQARITVTCRYINLISDSPSGLCSFEAVDPQGEILLCRKHLARTLELLRRSGFEITAPTRV